MHLIGQEVGTFRGRNQMGEFIPSFADIENNLFEAEGYNNSRFGEG